MTNILPVGRLRKSPFYDATLREGAKGFVPYNRMLIPRGYGDHEAEYWRLINGVSMWDVAAQRQVQVKGSHAAKLAQVLAVRDLSEQAIGQGKYVALCNHRGVLINDPIAMKVSEDTYWLSVSDSDIWNWAACVAGERGLDVEISEPDVSPLAVQGPKAEEVVASLLGDWVRDLRYFWFTDTLLDGIPLTVVRSGWSKQGGFELFLKDGSQGDQLWNLVKEAGQPFDIGPGYPNPSERTESGLLNWDVDTDAATNPFEVRMERFVDLDMPDDVIGVRALRQLKADGIKRHQLGIIFHADFAPDDQSIRHVVEHKGKPVGHMSHKAWSYRLEKMIGYALVSREVGPGDEVVILDGNRKIAAHLTDLPFPIDAS